MMNLKTMITALVLLGLGGPAMAEKLSLSAISTYFNGMKTAAAPFTQINDDGTISTGDIMIRRPGRIRFKYNPPESSFVMAGQGQVAVFDAKSNQPPEQFPLTKTPLYLILAKNVNFGQDKMVVAHTSDGTVTTITAQDPQHPEYGNIQLVFTGNPVALRQWIVTDGSGQQTTVILGELTLGQSMPARLFNIEQEMKARGF